MVFGIVWSIVLIKDKIEIRPGMVVPTENGTRWTFTVIINGCMLRGTGSWARCSDAKTAMRFFVANLRNKLL